MSISIDLLEQEIRVIQDTRTRNNNAVIAYSKIVADCDTRIAELQAAIGLLERYLVSVAK